MPSQERSAGVIVYRNPSGTVGTEEFLLLDYGRYWDYAKGHVEKGESDEVAARRELAEETGIHDVTLTPGFQREMAYFFRSKQGMVRKTVIYFLAQVDSAEVKISDEHVAYDWLPLDVAMARLGFASAREVLQAANDFLQR